MWWYRWQSMARAAAEMFIGDDGLIPKERYVSRAFLDLEMERLWPRVWQIACREEELAEVGDYVEYVIGDQSILVVRSASKAIQAFFNTCLHRGTRLAEGRGRFAEGRVRCRYHGWCYALDGRLTEAVDRHEFASLPDDLRLGEVRAECWGGFVFVNLDAHAEPLLDFLAPLPELLAPYRLEQMRLRSYLTTILPANWKAVVDAFNEGYHVQGAHAQILPWTDDVSLAYEQFRTHAHYGRLPNARRRLRPSPRLGISADQVDEGEILAALVGSLGGAFLQEERALVEELRAASLPPGASLLALYQERRMELLRLRGFDVSGLTPDQMTSAEDVYWFPNMVGPIYPGSAILFRVRPNGLDPDSAVKDTWVLAWPRPGEPWKMPHHRFYPDWTAKNWGEITNQDYANLREVQIGMKSRGCRTLRCNPRQEGNVLHMHRVIDRYLIGAAP
ncbi:MAG TPA: aromatic ring-hydroxylating dioxygenase subunit alpha [Candidatus Binatia bacterium]|nr:aromatic ring-hydroxylating dioxygenase subunit alpha [Candidatus Binatia bacterium]